VGTVVPAMAMVALGTFTMAVAANPHVLLAVHSVIEDVVSFLS